MHFKDRLKIGSVLMKLPTSHEKTPYYIDVHFIKLFSFALGFDYDFIYEPKGDLGTQLENGSWSGLVGMTNRSQIDFAMTPIGMTEERLEASDWSYPYGLIPMTFATIKPTYKTEWLQYLKPFSYIVWMCLIASIIAVSVTFYFASSRRYEFQRIFLNTYAAFTQNAIDVQPLRTSEYTVVIAWMTGVTFAIFCYTALLLSFMTIPTLSGVRTIEDLSKEVSKGTYKCITVPGAFAAKTLKMSSNPSIAEIGEDLYRNEKSFDIAGTMEDRESKIPAFVLAKFPLISFEEIYFVSDDVFFNVLFAMPIKKSFCCKKDLDRVVHYVTASGMFWKILYDMNFQLKLKIHASQPPENTDSQRQITVGDFKGAFVFLVLGHILSTLVFAIENISAFFNRRKVSRNDMEL